MLTNNCLVTYLLQNSQFCYYILKTLERIVDNVHLLQSDNIIQVELWWNSCKVKDMFQFISLLTKSISLSEVLNPWMSKTTTLGTNPTEFQNMESVLLDFQSPW